MLCSLRFHWYSKNAQSLVGLGFNLFAEISLPLQVKMLLISPFFIRDVRTLAVCALEKPGHFTVNFFCMFTPIFLS